ncbi:hypothetical protein [Enterobacter ludwigii]|uniref:hypothetical protein n=1 Tax=Enterobacter ludwigii TaxID=299767 RepID=UPI002FD5E117
MNKNGINLHEDTTYVVADIIENYSKTTQDVSSFKLNMRQRSNRPIACVNVDDDQCVFFQEVISAKIERKKISFSRPNEISLSMNIAKKSLDKALEIRSAIIKLIQPNQKNNFYGDGLDHIYDYLEEVQKTIIFSYKAIEALCNSAIPEDYTYKKDLSKKGISEIYNKSAIERWLSTSEKVSKILPDVYKCPSPSNQNFWGHFKKLEELRNEIIHSKSSTSSKLLSEILSSDIDKYFKSCESMLLYFFKVDKQNHFFPLTSKISELPIISWKDMKSYFKLLD